MRPRVTITVDVEADFGTGALRGVDVALPRLLDGFAARGVRAVAFVVGEVARRRPAMVREVVAAGHVLGSHTMRHRPLDLLSPVERGVELSSSRALLEDLSGAPCVAFRAPYFAVPPTLGRELEATGYRWSSSRSTFAPRGGYRHLFAPHEPHLWPGTTVLEVPVPGRRGLPLPEGLLFRRLVPIGADTGGAPPRVFYLHPYELLAAPPARRARERLSPHRVRCGPEAERLLWRCIDAWRARGAVFEPPVDPEGRSAPAETAAGPASAAEAMERRLLDDLRGASLLSAVRCTPRAKEGC